MRMKKDLSFKETPEYRKYLGEEPYSKFKDSKEDSALPPRYVRKAKISKLKKPSDQNPMLICEKFTIRSMDRCGMYNDTIDLVGYKIKTLVKHLASHFDEGMTWSNYGVFWEIDHTNPINQLRKKITNPLDLLRSANSLHNLRPMWKDVNRAKSDSTDFDIESFPSVDKHRALSVVPKP